MLDAMRLRVVGVFVFTTCFEKGRVMHRYSTDWDRHLVAGEWTQGRGDEYTNTNPFDDASIATIKLATERDVEDAYKAAERAQKRWARTNPTQKSEEPAAQKTPQGQITVTAIRPPFA